MTLTFRSRLTLVYTVVFGVLLTAVTATSYRVLAYRLDADATENLTELTTGLHGYLRFDEEVPTVAFDPDDPQEATFVHEATRYYQVFDADTGLLLVQSDAIAPLGLHFTPGEVRAFRDQPELHDLQTDYGRIRLSNSLIAPGNGHTYLVQVGSSLEGIDRALDSFLALLLVGVPVGLTAAFLAGRSVAAIALAPLHRLAAASEGIDIGDLKRRLPVRGTGDELDEVALAFNETLGRLEQAVGDMRQFSAALAHELRTPLAALRGEIEMTMLQPDRGVDVVGRRLASQLEEIDKLKRLIDRLLTLARAEAGEIQIARDPVHIDVLAASLVDQLELVAQERGIVLEREGEEAIVVEGDERWLEPLLLNLLDNALKFTPEGGKVTLRLSKEGSMARIEVRDTGVGMPPEIVPHIFDRFFRADPARSPRTDGIGLGLSLAKWIVISHRGSIDVTSEPGCGSTFTVRLPLLS